MDEKPTLYIASVKVMAGGRAEVTLSDGSTLEGLTSVGVPEVRADEMPTVKIEAALIRG